MRWTEKASRRRCYLSKDLKEVKVSHVDIWGKRSPGRGNSHSKGPKVGLHMVGYCGWNRVSDGKVVGGEVRKLARPDHLGHGKDYDFYSE